MGFVRSWALFIMIAWIFPQTAYPDDVEYRLKAGLKEEFSDNLFFDEDHEKEGWSAVLTTEAGVDNSSDRMKTALSGQWSRTFLKDYHRLNNDDWVVKSAVNWNAHEKTACHLNVSWGEDSDFDSYLSSTGLLLDTEKHEFLKGDMSVKQRFSERFSSELSLNYSDESTDSDTDDADDVDLTSKGGSAGIVFQASELALFQFYAGYGLYDYGTSTVEQVYASLGFSRNPEENLTFFCNAGSRYTTYTYKVLTGIDMRSYPVRYIYKDDHNYTWGLIGKAGLVYKTDDRSMQISIDESLQPSSGEARSMDRTSVDISGYRRLSKDLTLRLTTFFRLNRSDDGESEGKERLKTFGLSPGLSYQLADDFLISGAYAYTQYRSTDYQLRKNVFKIQIECSL